MDRVIVYDAALPQAVDILNTNMNAMLAQSFNNLAVLGSSTVVAGLQCIPTGPPSLSVTVTQGTIYQQDPIDQNAYGDLGTNSANVVKQGIVQNSTTLLVTPPSTSGFSQVYLVEVILSDVDAGQTVLSYYNSANPQQPFSGPFNSGTSQFTVRQCVCTITLKAGVPAATGSQTNPTTDPGFTPLYYITVSNGQTQILSANISQLVTAPFFAPLPQVPTHVMKGDWIWGTDTGVANAYVVTVNSFVPLPTAYQAGMGIRFKALTANSGAGGSTINFNGLGVVAIKRAGGATLAAGDIVSGQVISLVYDGVSFQMDNYLGISAGSTTNNFSTTSIPYIADTGTANAIVANYSPAITSGQQVAGLFLSVKLANAISTGACTINVNGLGIKNLDIFNAAVLANPLGGVFGAGEILLIVYDGTEYQIVTSSAAAGGGPIGPTGPAGPTGPQGPAGPQGVPGSFPTTPGAIGSFAFDIGGGTSGSTPSGSFYPGTWQQVSYGGSIPFAGFTEDAPLFLMQRTA